MAHTVLIVDDSPTAVPELKALLESEGYQVLTALRAEDALDMLRDSKVDLLITEALLPGTDGFELVRRVRQRDEWIELPIIMLTVRSATEDYAAGFEAGANEYFLKPLEAPKLIAATRGLIARHEMGLLHRAPAIARGAGGNGASPRSERGDIVTIFSLKGGVGTSTIAVNLAVAIKMLAPSARVGLIDLSLEEGTDALLLDIVPTSTVADWAQEDLREATPYLLNQYFTQHRTGVSLMGAPSSPEQAEIVKPDVVRLTLDLAPQAFDYVVVDTPSTFSEISLIALETAQAIVLPLMPDMASLHTTVSSMRILKAVKIDDKRLRLVVNEIVPRAGLTEDYVERGLGRPPDVIIPHAGSGFIDAANQGLPLVASEQPSASARAIFELAKSVCEPEILASSDAKRGLGLLGQRLGLERLRRT